MPLIDLGYSTYATIDESDRELVATKSWRLMRIKIAHRELFYAHAAGNVLLHRFLLCEPPCLVDHINGDGLDNRRQNLRLCTHTDNMRNIRKTLSRTSSSFKGVSWITRDRRWRAAIMVNRIRLVLGHFHDESDAAMAYDAAARHHFGKFARLNFPRDGEQPARS